MYLANKDKVIAIVIESLVAGGAERICIDIVKCLYHANYRVELVLFVFKGELLTQLPTGINIHVVGKKRVTTSKSIKNTVHHLSVNWVCLDSKEKITYSEFFSHVVANWPFRWLNKFPHRSSYLVRNANGFAAYLTQRKPDCVFAMKIRGIFTTLIGREISGNSVPIIWSAHGPITYDLRCQLRNFKELLHKADWTHTVSKRLKQEFGEQNLFSINKVTAIYNFVDSQRVLRLAEMPSGHPWLDQKKELKHRIILSVGRLHEQKNYTLLIQSFARLSFIENLRLVILGEGPLRHALQYQVNKFNLSNIVSMPGWVANPYAFMSRADVFVMSSNWEGFPMVIIEALTCECRVVSTDCDTGPKEALDNGRFGTLVPLNDPVALSAAINNALDSGPTPQQLSDRALQFRPERFLMQFDQMIGDAISAQLNY